MSLRIATWNVNSVRLRAEQGARFVDEQAPDVLCMQEIKCREGEFPAQAFIDCGLPYLRIKGQKGWHGVAIASRLPIEDAPTIEACRNGHARCVSATVAGVEIQNFYIPAGGDTPDREINEKFDHKLDIYERLTAETARRDRGDGKAEGLARFHRSGARSDPRPAETVFLVELPRRRLQGVEPRPQARSPVGVSGPGRRGEPQRQGRSPRA